MRYKVEFEFEIDEESESYTSPVEWHWQNLIDIDDEATRLDCESIRVYKNAGWVLA